MWANCLRFQPIPTFKNAADGAEMKLLYKIFRHPQPHPGIRHALSPWEFGMNTWVFRRQTSWRQRCQIRRSSWVRWTVLPADALQRTRNRPRQPESGDWNNSNTKLDLLEFFHVQGIKDEEVEMKADHEQHLLNCYVTNGHPDLPDKVLQGNYDWMRAVWSEWQGSSRPGANVIKLFMAVI